MTTPPAITDSHCHLDFPDFEGEHEALIARAAEAGVTRMVTICTRLRLEPQVRALAERFDPVFYAAGTHPMSAAEEPLTSVEELVAMGEMIVYTTHQAVEFSHTPVNSIHLNK